MHLRTLQKLFHPVVMYIESLSKYEDNVERTIGCNSTYLNAIALKKLKNKLKQNNEIIIQNK